MKTRDSHIQKLEGELRKLEGEILKLRGDAQASEGAARAALNEKIQDIEQRKAKTEAKLEELRNAGEDSWRDLKAGAERATAALKEAVKSATSRFTS